jgi:hypothetical protein
VVISPQGFHFAHAKALARAMMRETDVNWEFLFTSVWATTLRGRLRDLINEYQDAIPELRGVIDVFLGEVRAFRLDELFRRLSEFMASGRYAAVAPQLSLTHPNPEALFDLLLGLGFLGVRVQRRRGLRFQVLRRTRQCV